MSRFESSFFPIKPNINLSIRAGIGKMMPEEPKADDIFFDKSLGC
jgi:hypothetical protein